MSSSADYLRRYTERADQALHACLQLEGSCSSHLLSAMRYAVLAPGKRLRPGLCYATGELFDVSDMLDAPACAVELIHAYSLIHDDLPAMDDDDFRRGQPACHKAFGEAIAILAGDALQAFAFEMLANQRILSADRTLTMLRILAHACGSNGMAGGQALDLDYNPMHGNTADIETIHRYKTGALIKTSVELALIASDSISQATRDQLLNFAEIFGLAFQIRDDLLDHIPANSANASVSTRSEPDYTAADGPAKAMERLDNLYNQAMEILRPFGAKSEGLRAWTTALLNGLPRPE